MQSATLGLNQNCHGLLNLQDGTPNGILMHHNGLFKVLDEMSQILYLLKYCLKISSIKIMLIIQIFTDARGILKCNGNKKTELKT